jgi:hypothetical protein
MVRMILESYANAAGQGVVLNDEKYGFFKTKLLCVKFFKDLNSFLDEFLNKNTIFFFRRQAFEFK